MTTLIATPKLGHGEKSHVAHASVRHTDSDQDRSRARMPDERARTLREIEAERTWQEARLADYRRRATAFGRSGRSEDAVDSILAGSFPASDPPPWTLGDGRRSPEASTGAERKAIVIVSGARRGPLGWRLGVTSLVGAATAVLIFVLGILVVGATVALAVRLLYEVLSGARGWLPF